MDSDDLTQTVDWTKTKEAVANFRQLLLCSKCSKLLHEPVCLGTCEHMLCRSCAGPRAGDGCVVCHSPAWVKDIQINRQLSNITNLFCSLESLLNPTDNSDSCLLDPHPQPEDTVLKHKKNFKIWFSPRSRKVRCMVERPTEISPAEGKALEQLAASKGQDLSVFNFASSSQDSGSSSPRNHTIDDKTRKRKSAKSTAKRKPAASGARRVTRRQAERQFKAQRLEAINQQWGISTEDEVASGGEQLCSDTGDRRSSKRVSFMSPGVPEETQLHAPQGDHSYLRPSSGNLGGSLSVDSVSASETQPFQNTPGKPSQHGPLSSSVPKPNDGAEIQRSLTPPKPPLKRSRLEEKAVTSESTPNRPRASPSGRRRLGGRWAASHLTPPRSASPRCGRSPKGPAEQQRSSPSFPATVGRRPLCSPGSGVRTPQGSPAVMKRNHKGEAPLHLAAIKGDAPAVKELLDQGADPNLKDNAGWTPLHEACNLGHLAVVEVLLSGGALLNTPGYENHSPLHDAVMNGHPAIAKLLLKHGASPDVLNLHGKHPVDYAVSQEMQDIFQAAPEAPNTDRTPLSPPVSLSVGSVVFLARRLSRPQQKQLAKLERLLGWKHVEAFSCSVSHIVVPDGHVPTSLSTLRGILAGCWILRYTWVEACLQAGQWIPELEHEAGEGPRRSRINKYSLLPPLFDGCFFFLLGSFKAPPKDELTQLLREGGGQLLNRQPKPDCDVTQTLAAAAYHAPQGSDQALCTQYILYDPQGPRKPAMVRRGKVWSAPSTWLIDCIAAFRLLPVPEAEA